jgi:hypothetical protein
VAYAAHRKRACSGPPTQSGARGDPLAAMHRGGVGSDEGGPGADDEQARRVMGATGYLDDVALIGEPHVVAAGLAAFRTAVAEQDCPGGRLLHE